jgi:(4S)-4-hydroxy-5-phosphonooxypentane-2,3-dione isomerase
MYVVSVEFKLHPQHAADFQAAVVINARASVKDEPGCSVFDVCVAPDDATVVYLYEIYDDRAAFEAHLKTPHYAVFDKAVGPWVASKVVKVFTRVSP